VFYHDFVLQNLKRKNNEIILNYSYEITVTACIIKAYNWTSLTHSVTYCYYSNL
jgi:hypothetical protein